MAFRVLHYAVGAQDGGNFRTRGYPIPISWFVIRSKRFVVNDRLRSTTESSASNDDDDSWRRVASTERISGYETMSSSTDAAAEEAFRAKYGDGLRPKPRLIAKDVKHFDSADWAMRKSLDEGQRRASVDGGGDGTATGTAAGNTKGVNDGMPSDSARDVEGRMGTGARMESDASTAG